MWVPVAIGCWVLLMLAMVVFHTAYSRRRMRSLRQAARELGFEFKDSGKPFAGTDVQGLAILRDDPLTTVSDILTGQYGGCSMMVFDVAWCDESAENTALTTCAAFRSVMGSWPPFQITAKDAFERIRNLGAKKPDFADGAPKFAKRFSLHCQDDSEARKLFTPARLEDLRLRLGRFCIEGSADWILIYRPGVKVSANKLAAFVDATSALASVLLPENSFFLPAA